MGKITPYFKIKYPGFFFLQISIQWNRMSEMQVVRYRRSVIKTSQRGF